MEEKQHNINIDNSVNIYVTSNQQIHYNDRQKKEQHQTQFSKIILTNPIKITLGITNC